MAHILAIDIGSSKICVVVASYQEGNIDGKLKILGIHKRESKGVLKGVINNIDLVSNELRRAIDEVKTFNGIQENFTSAIVSISNACANWAHHNHSVRIVGNAVDEDHIKRVLNDVSYTSNIDSVVNQKSDKLHILPYKFLIDDDVTPIEDPMYMSGERLSCYGHIVTIEKSKLENLKRVLKNCGLENNDIVLSSYASSIAVLNNEDRLEGSICIDMGAEICDVMIHSGNSMVFNDFLFCGSKNITADLSKVINISQQVAEKLKLHYVDMLLDEQKSDVGISIAELSPQHAPIPIDHIWEIAETRVRETFLYLDSILKKSEFKNSLRGSVIFTGGMAKIKNLQQYANQMNFFNLNVRIGTPTLESLPEELKDPEMSVVVGLLMYAMGYHTKYELPLSGKMKFKDSGKKGAQPLPRNPFAQNIDKSSAQPQKGQHIENSNNVDFKEYFDDADVSGDATKARFGDVVLKYPKKLWEWLKNLF